MINTIQKMFLGNSPSWYKSTIVVFLIINPIALIVLNSLNYNGEFIVGWMFLLEFIFTLALALKCYPLQPGGLLAIEAIALGLTTAAEIQKRSESKVLDSILRRSLVKIVNIKFFIKNIPATINTSKSITSRLFSISCRMLSVVVRPKAMASIARRPPGWRG